MNINDLPLYNIEGIDYRDFSQVCIDDVACLLSSPQCKRKGPPGGVVLPFPVNLYNMLHDTEKENLDNIVCWQPHGRSFVIRDTKKFAEKIMKRYFKQSKVSSFQRQLNLYSFNRLNVGVDAGCYYHPLFLRGRPDLSHMIQRSKGKQLVGTGSEDVQLAMTLNLPLTNFYAMPSSSPNNISLATRKAKTAEKKEYRKAKSVSSDSSSASIDSPSNKPQRQAQGSHAKSLDTLPKSIASNDYTFEDEKFAATMTRFFSSQEHALETMDGSPSSVDELSNQSHLETFESHKTDKTRFSTLTVSSADTLEEKNFAAVMTRFFRSQERALEAMDDINEDEIEPTPLLTSPNDATLKCPSKQQI